MDVCGSRGGTSSSGDVTQVSLTIPVCVCVSVCLCLCAKLERELGVV